MRFATLISWLVTAALGAFMLRTWLARGGLRRERAKPGGLPPPLIFGHAVAAVAGLLAWAAFVASGARPFAWGAVVLLTVAVSLGLSTVTLWAPYPAAKPGQRRQAGHLDDRAGGIRAAGPGEVQSAFEVTDEMITDFLAAPAPRGYPMRLNPAVIIPVAHGFAALTTYLLAVMSAIT